MNNNRKHYGMKKRNITTLWLVGCLSLSAAVTILPGCAGNKYDRSTGEYIDDKALAMRVKHALHENSEYKLSGVDVQSFRNNIQLSGFVDTEQQKQEAADIARKVQNVRSVENNITVKTGLSQNP